jgi:hypothetical protein
MVSLAAMRSAVTSAVASRLKVMCRYHPSQLLTSNSSKPACCFAHSKHTSMAQRRPAARAKSFGVASGFAQHR